MAAKYRGKHNGKTRGEYVREELLYTSRDSEKVLDLEEKLNIFLGTKGYCVGVNICHENDYREHTFAYHMAGATIGMKGSYFNKAPANIPQYFVHLCLISNDNLRDVVKKIASEFPQLKDFKPHNYF